LGSPSGRRVDSVLAVKLLLVHASALMDSRIFLRLEPLGPELLAFEDAVDRPAMLEEFSSSERCAVTADGDGASRD